MLHLNDGHFFRDIRVLLLSVIFLALIQSLFGKYVVVGPSQPIVAIVGNDITLPCRLKPDLDASVMAVAWMRPDLNPEYVHVWSKGVEDAFTKHLYYDGRTSLSIKKLKQGDISLKLSTVELSDNGTYKCYVSELNIQSLVQLVVGAVPSHVPTIAEINSSNGRVVLQCESKGWYPEPEVFWLDGERKLLSAGPTETVRGPDDLYTVISRVTVEKKHSNNFTCRVQQNHINQTRETHIQISDDSLAPITTAITIPLLLVVVVGVSVCVWKFRHAKKISKRTTKQSNAYKLVDYPSVRNGSQSENVRCDIQPPEEESTSNNTEVQQCCRETENRTRQTEEDELDEHTSVLDENDGSEIQLLTQEEAQESTNHEIRNNATVKQYADENKKLKEDLKKVQLQLQVEKERVKKSEREKDKLLQTLQNTLQKLLRKDKSEDLELEDEAQDSSEEKDAELQMHRDSEHKDSDTEDSNMDSDLDNSRT